MIVTVLWLLKPVRTASLLAHLGAAELPYLRFVSVFAVFVVVLVYSRVVNHLSRLDVVRGASLFFGVVTLALWAALRLGGETLGAQRWFVWLVFTLVDVYSTVMVTIFWTYTDDVVLREEADRLYGPIGLGGIVGGIAGGVLVDRLVKQIGPVDILLLCVPLIGVGGALGWITEHVLRPPPRTISRPLRRAKHTEAWEGAREVLHNRYLLWIVAIVISYEFAAAVTDFAINVVFERAFQSEIEIAQMYGRLGWIVSGTALVSQLLIVPYLLPFKRAALVLPPIVMLAATIGLAASAVVGFAILVAASDRGLNYSLQQVTKETLYVPLTDLQKYKAKAFIDVVVDRLGKALSSIALLIVIAVSGVSIELSLAVAVVALLVWAVAANALGRTYDEMQRDKQRAAKTGSPALTRQHASALPGLEPEEWTNS